MDDSQLIREIKAGNVELYSVLMRRYQRKILAFTYYMLKGAGLGHLAEDVSSETFYKAFKSLQSFREVEASFSTWLYTIARNTALSELRRHRSTNVPLEDGELVTDSSTDAAPEQALLRSEQVGMVRTAIDNLPEKQRAALILREYDQMDYQEIARILGQSISSVKSLLFRARLSIKTQLEPYYYGPVYEEETYKGMRPNEG